MTLGFCVGSCVASYEEPPPVEDDLQYLAESSSLRYETSCFLHEPTVAGAAALFARGKETGAHVSHEVFEAIARAALWDGNDEMLALMTADPEQAADFQRVVTAVAPNWNLQSFYVKVYHEEYEQNPYVFNERYVAFVAGSVRPFAARLKLLPEGMTAGACAHCAEWDKGAKY